MNSMQNTKSHISREESVKLCALAGRTRTYEARLDGLHVTHRPSTASSISVRTCRALF